MEQLVECIYSPSPDPAVLHQAQEELRAAQNSATGWTLAQTLLDSVNPNAQFLGAQTFLVQLNQANNLPPRPQICSDLLLALRSAVSKQLPAFVVRKLLGAITKAYFLVPDWVDCPLQVLQILQPISNPLCFEFLNFLVQDAEISAASLRAKLVPGVSKLVNDLVSVVGLNDLAALNTIEVWATAFFDEFRDLVPALLDAMQHAYSSPAQDEDLVVALTTCVSNLYVNHWRSWRPSTVHDIDVVLQSVISQRFTPSFQQDDEVFVAFVRLVITVCEEDLMGHNELHPFIATVAATNVPVVDDPLSSEVLEFWNQYTEDVISTGLSSSSSAAGIIVPVISGYWPRIKLYPQLRQSDWEEMASFRKDFADFLELAYPLLGLQLFDHLATVVLSSLDAGDWMSIESALYCLNGLADIIGTDYNGQKPEFHSVQRIFQSSLWEQLPQCDHLRVKQTAVNTIGCFVDFFLSPEGLPYLAITLNYLFSTLHTSFLQNTASRSIQKLCDTCRSQLVNEIPAFLEVYERIRSQLASVPHIRTVAAITCVVQAVEDINYKLQCIDRLFTMTVSMPQPQDMSVEEWEHTRLKCVAAVGKYLQSTDCADMAPAPPDIQLFLRPRLKELITHAAQSPDLSITEASCEIIKVCMADDIYSLDEQFVVLFIVSKAQAGPSVIIPPVVDLARVFVATRLANLKRKLGPTLSSDATQQLLELAVTQGNQAVSNTIDLLTQIVLTLSLTGQSSDTALFLRALELPLQGLGSTDRFVLRSAVAFWKEYLAAFPLSSDIGVHLVRILLLQASGRASRSELVPVSEIYKSLMSKQPLIGSQLLKQYVVDEPAGRQIAKQDEKTRRDFVAQLVLVKGGRKTVDIVQQFWLKCRGIPASYDPQPVV